MIATLPPIRAGIGTPPACVLRPHLRRFLGICLCSLMTTLLSPLSSRAAESLEKSFLTPPASSRALTWWHWMNGNVTKPGITRDLEAMKTAGVQGAILFNVGLLPEGPVTFMSEAWWDCVRHTMRESDRLGLKFGIFNSDGWSMSGGPWIPIEDSMKQLVWEEIQVVGGRKLQVKIPQPKTNIIYEDIALLAFPSLPREEALGGFRVIGADGVKQPANLFDGDPATRASFESRADDEPASHVILDLGEPKTLRRLVFEQVDVNPSHPTTATLEHSSDGERFERVQGHVVLNLRYDSDLQSCTLGFPEITARFLKLNLALESPKAAGPNGGTVRVRTGSIGNIHLHESPRVTFWEPKSGQSKIIRHDRQPQFQRELALQTKETLPAEWRIDRRSLVDLTGQLDPDGMLTWEAPEGDWTVLRVGYTSTLRKNAPASAAGHGYECDKMSVAATERHFHSYLGRMVNLARETIGRPLDFAQMESWEAGIQNWTDDFETEFARRRGYDLRPFLPVLTGGRVVDSYEASNRLLWDMRRTVAELMGERYWATMHRLCREHGVQVLGEGSGMQHYLYDPILYHRHTDVPMGEFWTSEGSVRADCKNAASVANTYGKPLVAAEAFTGGGEAMWRYGPADLKLLGDEAFLLGVNQFVLHTYVHQPHEVGPGFTLGQYGNHFQRLNPWYTAADGWFDYIARCQFLLRQGRFVADLSYFTGEGIPGYLGLPQEVTPALPAGYDYDGFNLDLLRQMTVHEGRAMLPSGMAYPVLAFQDSSEMTLDLVREIGRIVEAGATVVADRPSRTPSQLDASGAEQEWKARVEEIWGPENASSSRDRRYGKGRLVAEPSLATVLTGMGIAPDFEAPDATTKGQLGYLHRRLDDGELYFVVNRTPQAYSGRCVFRDGSPHAELWDPKDGRITSLTATRTEAGRISVPLTLEPRASCFVFLRNSPSDGKAAPPAPAPATAGTKSLPMDEGWSIAFEDPREGPVAIDLDRLIDWSLHPDVRLRTFSGTAVYRRAFDVPSGAAQPSARVELDLGEVHEVATVRVNGRRLANLWSQPYRLDITQALIPGRNTLEIKVTNTAANRLIGDEQHAPDDPESPLRVGSTVGSIPSWLAQPDGRSSARRSFVTFQYFSSTSRLEPSGLVGPVRLVLHPP
jgi:hypothetical protein